MNHSNNWYLECMSNSIRVISYEGSQIVFRGKCHKPFKQLRYLQIESTIPDLPMEINKLEHLSIYRGPLVPGMSFNEVRSSLLRSYLSFEPVLIKLYNENWQFFSLYCFGIRLCFFICINVPDCILIVYFYLNKTRQSECNLKCWCK